VSTKFAIIVGTDSIINEKITLIIPAGFALIGKKLNSFSFLESPAPTC